MLMPAATGIMLNLIPQTMRTSANSLANFGYNLFGYVPAPYLYGLAYTHSNSTESHSGLIAVQTFVLVAYGLVVVLYIRKRLQYKRMLVAEYSETAQILN